MQAFVAKLQLALQSRGLLEVPPESNPTNELADLKATLRKLEIAEGNLPDKQAPAEACLPVGVLAGEDLAADAVAVVISGAFIKNLLHNHIINKKKIFFRRCK
jgi:hypothetical protein